MLKGYKRVVLNLALMLFDLQAFIIALDAITVRVDFFVGSFAQHAFLLIISLFYGYVQLKTMKDGNIKGLELMDSVRKKNKNI